MKYVYALLLLLAGFGCETPENPESAERPITVVIAPTDLPLAEWLEDDLLIEPPILKIDEEPKTTTISWKEPGPAEVRIHDFRGVLVRELEGEKSVTWNGTWPNHNQYPAPAEDGPYEVFVRLNGKVKHRGIIYIDRAGPPPRYLYMRAHRRFPRSKVENSPESTGEQMSVLRYGVEPCFGWWWGIEKNKEEMFVWDRGKKKVLPKGNYGAGVYFLNGRFILQVAADPQFKKIVHQSRHRTKPWGYNIPLKKGHYYWRLVGMDARGNPVLKYKDPNTGKTVPYSSQVVGFDVDPLPIPKRKLPPSPVKDMSRKKFESLAFSKDETEKWGKPKAITTSKFTKGQNAYWYGSKIERSWLSKRLSARRRIGSFEMALSEQAYYPNENLIVIFKLNTDAAIDENLKKYRPPRESYNTRFDNGNFFEHVKVRWKAGFDNPDRLQRLGLKKEEVSKFSFLLKVISRRDGKPLYTARLPASVRHDGRLPKGARYVDLKKGEQVNAFDAPVGFEIDSSMLPLALAGTQQFIAEAALFRSGKPVQTVSRIFGRTRRPSLYRMDWGKIEINDDRAIYINGRPVFPHSLHRGDPVTTRLHGFNANFANGVPAATANKIHSIQVEIANRRGNTARNFGRWLLHEPSFEKSIDFWNAAKKMDPKENILLISTTTGMWTGECKVFDYYAAHGTGFKRPLMVLPYQHVGGPELTAFTIDTGVARAMALERMGVRSTVYTECGIYRIGGHLTPHGPMETMANAYAAIVHGCRGIDWFGEYSHENGGALSYLQPDTYSQVYRVLAAQINWLQPILSAHRVEQDSTIWPKTARILKKIHDGKTYLFTVRYGTGATTGVWNWIRIAGEVAHYHRPSKRIAAHSILFGTNTALQPKSVIRQKVWLDPKNPPNSIGLEFVNRKLGLSKWFIIMDWDHRAFWGDSSGLNIGLRPDDGEHPSHLNIGPLPQSGQWVTLEIPVEKLSLRHSNLDDRHPLTGMAFTTNGGRAFWGETRIVHENGQEAHYFTKAEIDRCQSYDETMRITLPGLKAGTKINVLFEDRRLTAQDGYFEDRFDREDYDVHIYEIPSNR